MKKLVLLFRVILVTVGLLFVIMQVLLFFLGDYGTGESLITRLLLSLGFSVSVGVVLGYLLRSLWWLTLVSALIPILFLFSVLLHLITGRAVLEDVLYIFVRILPMAAVLSSAYLGAWLERKGKGKLVLLVILIGILGIAGSMLFVKLFSPVLDGSEDTNVPLNESGRRPVLPRTQRIE